MQRRESVEPLGKAMYWPGGNSSLNVVLSETAIDASEGVVRVTDNPLDVAISGRGFLPSRRCRQCILYQGRQFYPRL